MGVWQWPALGFEEKENEKNNTPKRTYEIDQCYRL
jgi:hypothetical protein